MLGPYSEAAQMCIATELQNVPPSLITSTHSPHTHPLTHHSPSHPPTHHSPLTPTHSSLTPTHSLITPPHTHPLITHTHPLACCEAGSLFLRELYSESIVISSWERGHPPERGTSPVRGHCLGGYCLGFTVWWSLFGWSLSGGSLFWGHCLGVTGGLDITALHTRLWLSAGYTCIIVWKNTKAFRICSLAHAVLCLMLVSTG